MAALIKALFVLLLIATPALAYTYEPYIYTCHICKKTYETGNVTCLVQHGYPRHCHYGEIEVVNNDK